MLRFRRYRVFLAFAVISVLTLYHFTALRQWDKHSAVSVQGLKDATGFEVKNAVPPDAVAPKETRAPTVDANRPILEVDDGPVSPTTAQAAADPLLGAALETNPPMPQLELSVKLPDKDPAMLPIPTQPPDATVIDEKEIVIAQHGEGRKEITAKTGGPVVHWTKLPEHFPIPSESLIPLPSGKAKTLPKIQFPFTDENSNDKIDRERKLAAVKESFVHSWKGYKEFAWLQDELSPVSGSFRNPFCGWAATLVDALDSLWIMGLKDEFEEAVKAVNQIDFTTTFRGDIPLFETTIRYLGGLIAAYDISGAKYRVLLDKAVELAEILMGAFDTPNRMPITYYHWKPAYASQPHRASTRVVLAEIGSLSVEFTRLAQITKDVRYYDAIARITNEFEVWQNSTKLPGMWPVYIDASGCKKTGQPATSSDGPGLALPKLSNAGGNHDQSEPNRVPGTEVNKEQDSKLPEQIMPQKARIGNWDDELQDSDKSTLGRRQLNQPNIEADHTAAADTARPTDKKFSAHLESTCEPQGLASPPNSKTESFTLGGMSDSLYEYLPKEYMLLGGLNDQYRTMYEYAIEAVKEYLLFRPMAIDERDILLSGSLKTTGHLDIEGDAHLTPEGAHLTCFAGGMFAIAAKLFDRKDELALGAKLTDGCVWAYESTVTGIMPEGFYAIPCSDSHDCAWNESRWWDALDPHAAQRQNQRKNQEQQAVLPDNKPSLRHSKIANFESASSHSDGSDQKGNQQDRGTPLERRAEDLLENDRAPSENPLGTSNSGSGDSASSSGLPTSSNPEPLPLTHEEFVKARIDKEGIPPGFSGVFSNKYILRPEAIESVFIMYRVTGDQYWRDKGWAMFTAIENYTRTEFGNSAIDNVNSPEPKLLDEMESFWLAETLKYFYLLFSPPDLVSLDEYVLNTEAHPFKRPK